MTEHVREPIGKKLRFEVFKRDKFTCQYCGQKAPDVILEVDHIQPVADGGKSDILNLITSCKPCNGGKGARLLTDGSVVELQRRQIEELEERRQQLEMMLEWRAALSTLEEDEVEAICRHIGTKAPFVPNASGRQNIRKWLLRYKAEELIAATDKAFAVYLQFIGDDTDEESWEKAFSKIPGVANVSRQSEDKPYLRDLFYIQGILRRRVRSKRLNCVKFMESIHLDGVSIEELSRAARRADSWDEFELEVEEIANLRGAARE